MRDKPRFAFIYRYGPADHAEMFHALPEVVEQLAQHAEVHYFSMRSPLPVPPVIARHAVIHQLPVTCRRTDNFDKYLKTLLWPLLVPWLALRCRMLKCSAIYINETIPLVATLVRLFYRGKVAYTITDMFVEIYRERSFLIKLLGRFIQAIDHWGWRRLALVFTRTHSICAYLARLGVPPERIRTVYDPSDFALYHPLPADRRLAARQRYGYQPGEIVLAHHGILHPNKGNDRIIRALADLLPSHPQIKYLLIGDGPELAALRHLVVQCGLEKQVQFTGWLETPGDVNTALNAGDIGLAMRIGLPSDHFHLTGALVHAMACGLPVLAARLGGMAEVVAENRNGLLFDPGDMDEFKRKLLELSTDPAKRSAYGRAAHADARRLFSMDAVTRGTVTPLLELMRDAGGIAG